MCFMKKKRVNKNKKLMTSLYAVKDDNSKSVLLTMKDGLNKVMEKFSHINEYELTTKINQAGKQLF